MTEERRGNPRVKIKVPIELVVEGTNTPIRGTTSDLSLGGCYVESMFPLAIGTKLEVKLQTNSTLLILGVVTTSDPQVGNGILFSRMLTEDIDELRTFLDAAQREHDKLQEPSAPN